MPTSVNQIVVLLVFLIPGFILMRVKRAAYPVAEVSAAETVLDSLALSCLIYALASPLVFASFVNQWAIVRPVLFGFLCLFVLLLVPFLLGLLYVRLASAEKLPRVRELLGFPLPDPTAWDYFFRKRRPYWVWLVFKNGKMMAGLFGPNSFASAYPNRRDLYIEKLLRLDDRGNVVEFIQSSAGALVEMDDVERVQFYDVEGASP